MPGDDDFFDSQSHAGALSVRGGDRVAFEHPRPSGPDVPAMLLLLAFCFGGGAFAWVAAVWVGVAAAAAAGAGVFAWRVLGRRPVTIVVASGAVKVRGHTFPRAGSRVILESTTQTMTRGGAGAPGEVISVEVKDILVAEPSGYEETLMQNVAVGSARTFARQLGQRCKWAVVDRDLGHRETVLYEPRRQPSGTSASGPSASGTSTS